jgi:hypothetical protein
MPAGTCANPTCARCAAVKAGDVLAPADEH